MEQYREKLKISCRITAVLAVILIGFSIFCLAAEAGLVELAPMTGDSHWQSKWRGFISGATFGIAIWMVAALFKSIQALKDDKKLKKLYVQLHDERTQQIWTAARAAAMQLCCALGLVAVIITGYFNITICLTILACTMCLALTGGAFKLYYSKKF